MMLNWLRKLVRVVANYDKDIQRLRNQVVQLEQVLRERTDVAVDVGFRSACHVIVVGRYKNADYVQTYTLNEWDLSGLINRLREMETYGVVKRVDAPPQFRAVFERDIRG